MALRRTFQLTPVLLLVLSAAACQSQPGPPASGDKTGATTLGDGSQSISMSERHVQQPRTATYNCAGGGSMTIENLGSSIHVLGADGALDEELPASPANQNSRFGAEHDAVVIDGRDALIMQGGRTPVTCTR
jgi:hypothetical protein